MFAPSLMEKGESIPIFLTPLPSPWIWASQILTNQTNVFSKAGPSAFTAWNTSFWNPDAILKKPK